MCVPVCFLLFSDFLLAGLGLVLSVSMIEFKFDLFQLFLSFVLCLSLHLSIYFSLYVSTFHLLPAQSSMLSGSVFTLSVTAIVSE